MCLYTLFISEHLRKCRGNWQVIEHCHTSQNDQNENEGPEQIDEVADHVLIFLAWCAQRLDMPVPERTGVVSRQMHHQITWRVCMTL